MPRREAFSIPQPNPFRDSRNFRKCPGGMGEKIKMTTKTLIQILTARIAYDSSWAIYAELIDGKFKPESPSRYGQRIFDNGGLLDDCILFAANDHAVDFLTEYTEGDEDFLEEAAIELIQNANEGLG